ncbi:galactose oxidase [Corallococcus sp. BB11-1]|uniref:Kelch repeat-containing protein n=1 Tax=Corallococcus sp. BB11-1 TaxID=2996783 RepID=UPI0022710042|nr:kelch repeat-containing protein [Corallococcus sp. BB11-1]MCY1030141.1 galactose oxidase [Corallococcus sp. BB11-1]
MRRFSTSCVTVLWLGVMFSCGPAPRADAGGVEAPVPGVLSTPRRLLPYVALEDGRVLAAGGHDGHRTLGSSEVFDPDTGRWRPSGALRTARRNHAAVRLADGRVLAVGGSNGVTVGALASAEVYAPDTGTWTPVASMGEARNDPTAVLLPDGRVLVAGGTDVDLRPVRSAELYDPAMGAWRPAEAPGFVRGGEGTAVVLRSGRVLFASGLQAELYDPVTGHWEKAGAVGGAAGTHRLGHTVTLLPDGRVLVVGGTTSRAAQTAEVFVPERGAWELVASPSVPREHHAALVTGEGAVLVVGGEHSTRGTLASAEQFDPARGMWTQAPTLHEPRGEAGALWLRQGTVLVVGGVNELGTLATSEEYVPATCVPMTCEARGPACGVALDGCGATLDCGPCVAGALPGVEQGP